METTPQDALQLLYSATRQLNAGADVHEQLRKAYEIVSRSLPPLCDMANEKVKDDLTSP